MRQRVRRNRGRRVVYAFGLSVVTVLAATVSLLMWPEQAPPAHADAIIMFAGSGNRLSLAMQLADERRARVLVVSRGRQGYGGPCPAATGVAVVCFDPNPSDTRGEAEFAARLAKRNHWQSMILVTGRAQMFRAYLLMSRCYSGHISVVSSPLRFPSVPGQVAYETGALVKALVFDRAC